MSYFRFAAMILASMLIMFGLMYLNTYASEHLFHSETRAYMAILMGSVMALVMLAFMWGMYAKKALNIGIMAGSIVVFALSLWLVRSQTTVNGLSYLRAMIPHHSIAIMTSTRADINDARAASLAEDIAAAQNKEIAEMRYMIAAIESSGPVDRVYQDPEPVVGTVDDALGTLRLAGLDPAPLTADEAARALGEAPVCGFRRTGTEDPLLWVSADGTRAATRLNGVFVAMEGSDRAFAAQGMTMTLSNPSDGADWRSDAELIWQLNPGPTVGYRGFSDC